MSVSFYNRQDANEYRKQKLSEGVDSHIIRKNNKYIVYLLGNKNIENEEYLYHRLKDKSSLIDVLETGLDPEKREGKDKLIFLSKNPELWDKTNAELKIKINKKQLIRDPDVHKGIENVDPNEPYIFRKSHEEFFKSLPEWLEHNNKNNNQNVNEVIKKLKIYREKEQWKEYEELANKFVDESSDEEWENGIGYYATSEKISPDNFIISESPIAKKALMELGYTDFYSLPPKRIKNGEFLDALIESSGSLENAKKEAEELKENRKYKQDDRVRFLFNSIKEREQNENL